MLSREAAALGLGLIRICKKAHLEELKGAGWIIVDFIKVYYRKTLMNLYPSKGAGWI